LLPLFPLAYNLTLIVQYWLVSGMDSSLIYISRITCFTIKLNYLKLVLTNCVYSANEAYVCTIKLIHIYI